MSGRRSLVLALALCSTVILPVQAAPDRGLNLIDAAHRGDAAMVKSLLKAHVSVNATTGDGATALAWATANADLDMVKLLLAAHADPNKANDYGVTPLSLAIQNGQTSLALALINAGARPDMAMWTGETPLMFASRIGDTAIMKALIQHGAKVNAQETRHGQTALMWAAAAGKIDAVRLLIANKANADIETPRVEVKIVSAGAPNGPTTVLPAKKGGVTAIMFAAGSLDSNTDIIEALIAAGASVNRQAADGSTPLLFATLRHGPSEFLFPHDSQVLSSAEMATTLLKHGANPNIADNNGVTPLTATVFCAYGTDFPTSTAKPHDAMAEAAAKVLLANGADPNIMIKYYAPPEPIGQDIRYPAYYTNVSAFTLAATLNKPNLVKMIMASGRVNLDKPREGGNTPLMDAVQVGAPLALEALLNAGAKVDAVNPINGQTALHMAAAGAGGAGPMVKMLIDHGAKYDVKDKDGKIPVDLAKAGGDGCKIGTPCRIGSGTVVDALFAVKDGKAVAPDSAIVVLGSPTDPQVVSKTRPAPPGVDGGAMMIAIATGKPLPQAPASTGRGNRGAAAAPGPVAANDGT